MTDATFEKVESSDKPLYGPRKVLLCGFSADAQAKFRKLVSMLEIASLPLVWVSQNQSGETLAGLLALPDGSGADQSSALPRAIVVSGVTHRELHRLMGGCRQAGMQQALWAVLTPVSEQWKLGDLLKELAAEHAAMAQKKRP